MMRILSTAVFTGMILFGAITVFGQQYSKLMILKKADSVLISRVGARVFADNFVLNSATADETPIDEVIKASKFNKIMVNYTYHLSAFSSEVRLNYAEVTFNNKLDIIGLPDLKYIPVCTLTPKPCTILADTVAVNIGKATFKNKPKRPISNKLLYDVPQKQWLWRVYNAYADFYRGFDHFYYLEVVEINPFNGNVLSYNPKALSSASR